MKELFQDFVKYAEQEKLFIEGIAVADRENVLMEHRFTPDLERNIYSHTKSYMATAVGIAIEEGLMSLDDKLADYFPECVPEHADPRLFKITLRHLLTMSSGFGLALLMNADRRSGVGFPDYISYMMRLPFKYEPGERFDYSTADSILAGRMLAKATGENLGQYLYRNVFSKLDQGWPIWENDPQGHPIGGGGMYMKLTDMMKLGQLYLNDGVWKNERIVSSEWVKEATKLQIETPLDTDPHIWRCGYGYQFWMSPFPEAYRADGAYGQISTVFPKQDLVVAVQCPEYGDFEKVRKALHERFFLPLSQV